MVVSWWIVAFLPSECSHALVLRSKKIVTFYSTTLPLPTQVYGSIIP